MGEISVQKKVLEQQSIRKDGRFAAFMLYYPTEFYDECLKMSSDELAKEKLIKEKDARTKKESCDEINTANG